MCPIKYLGFPVAQLVKNLPAVRETSMVDTNSGHEWGILENWFHDCYERFAGFACQLFLCTYAFLTRMKTL